MTLTLLEKVDWASWLRMVAYVSIFMMCLFVAIQWRSRLRLVALAGMAYCVVRIFTTLANALSLSQLRVSIDIATVLAVYLVAGALAVTIYQWLRFEAQPRAR